MDINTVSWEDVKVILPQSSCGFTAKQIFEEKSGERMIM